MNADRLQTAVWLLTPLIGLVLLLTVMTLRVGVMVVPLVVLLFLMMFTVAALLRRGMASTTS